MVALFLVVHLSLVVAGSGIAAFGLIERVGFVIMIGYLFLLAATIDREGLSKEPVGIAEPALLLSGSRSADLVG